VAPGEVMAKANTWTLPKDRTGQKFRCYNVVRTAPKDPRGQYYVLKCSECGAERRSQWYETTKVFCPLPCDCGKKHYSKLKVGDIRNNKKVLKIKVTTPGGLKKYEILVKCLNCGAVWTINRLKALRIHHGKPAICCKHCRGDSVRIDHTGREIGTWKIIDEEKESMTCKCLKCKHKIVLLRKHIGRLNIRKCSKCLENQKKVDRNKAILILHKAGYSYKAIGKYFRLPGPTVRAIAIRTAKRHEGPV